MSEAKRKELRADVALMRELGVARWGDIVLGPSVVHGEKRDLTEEEVRNRMAGRAQAEHDVLFAATGIRPRITPLRGVK